MGALASPALGVATCLPASQLLKVKGKTVGAHLYHQLPRTAFPRFWVPDFRCRFKTLTTLNTVADGQEGRGLRLRVDELRTSGGFSPQTTWGRWSGGRGREWAVVSDHLLGSSPAADAEGRGHASRQVTPSYLSFSA